MKYLILRVVVMGAKVAKQLLQGLRTAAFLAGGFGRLFRYFPAVLFAVVRLCSQNPRKMPRTRHNA